MATLKDVLRKSSERVKKEGFSISGRYECVQYTIEFANPLRDAEMNKILKMLKSYTISAYASERNNEIKIYISKAQEKATLENIDSLLLRIY